MTNYIFTLGMIKGRYYIDMSRCRVKKLPGQTSVSIEPGEPSVFKTDLSDFSTILSEILEKEPSSNPHAEFLSCILDAPSFTEDLLQKTQAITERLAEILIPDQPHTFVWALLSLSFASRLTLAKANDERYERFRLLLVEQLATLYNTWPKNASDLLEANLSSQEHASLSLYIDKEDVRTIYDTMGAIYFPPAQDEEGGEQTSELLSDISEDDDEVVEAATTSSNQQATLFHPQANSTEKRNVFFNEDFKEGNLFYQIHLYFIEKHKKIIHTRKGDYQSRFDDFCHILSFHKASKSSNDLSRARETYKKSGPPSFSNFLTGMFKEQLYMTKRAPLLGVDPRFSLLLYNHYINYLKEISKSKAGNEDEAISIDIAKAIIEKLSLNTTERTHTQPSSSSS